MSLRTHIVSQFGRPRGLVGRLAGLVMSRRPSNVERNRRTVELLDVQPHHHVLEIGFGPGLSIADVAARATAGRVVGVDHSRAMVRAASRRNARAVASGLVELRQADARELPEGPFDRIFAVNVVLFWDDPVAVLRRIRDQLREDGIVALTLQPRSAGATDADGVAAGERLVAMLEEAGFAEVLVHEIPVRPLAVCVTGRRATS